jgi:hypothetical protein
MSKKEVACSLRHFIVSRCAKKPSVSGVRERL